ncbi:lipopolysaccharide biosynthesis protein [Bacillus sp. ISL-7]|uniref:lipopolysaccharide biosynthesis protein n=1 Tax=Bacillus sp. ISL-7 TaxID=2819136 RepID=UPI001BE62117|nr:oligosaccharide flippase family protein [Bacillus sp. ISL-7]MBT2738387.1 oligosaccharide flippase family protein [Bacillus sp. ISL-7]
MLSIIKRMKLGSIWNFGLFSILQLSIQGLNLVINILLTRKISVHEFGTYSIILTILGIVSTLGFSWSASILTFHGSKEIADQGNMRKTIQARNLLLLISVTITSILFVIFNRQINDYVGYSYSLLIFVWVIVRGIQENFSFYFIAREKKIVSSLLGFLPKIITVLALLVANVDLLDVLYISVASEALSLILLVYINKEDFRKADLDKEYFLEVLKFGLWQLFGSMAIYVTNFGDNFVIKYFLNSKEVGIYNAAYKLFAGIYLMSNIISSFFVAKIVKYFQSNDKRKVKEFFFNTRILFFSIIVLVHIICILLAKPIFIFVYPNEYMESVKIFQVLLIASICRYWTVFEMLYFNINKMYHVQQILNILSAGLNILLDIVLVPIYGILGAAIATTVSIVLVSIISFWICEPKILKFVRE